MKPFPALLFKVLSCTKLSLTQIESDLSPNWRQKLPISESQCRELAKLPSKQQPFAWDQVLEVSGDKGPTAKAVRSVVEQIKERLLFLATDFCAPVTYLL